jgi:NTE family protein
MVMVGSLFGSGCASSKVKSAASSGGAETTNAPQGPIKESKEPAEIFGPPAPAVADAPSAVYGPAPIKTNPIVLVLGPGLARGFAYVGVVRALHEAKIPIGAILGTEMGAFIGALYAMDGKINQFEWALQKFKDDTISPTAGMFSTLFQRSRNSRKLETELKQYFGKKDLNQSMLPLKIAIQFQGNSSVTVLDRGLAAEAIQAAMADLEVFDPVILNGVKAQSAASLRPFLISEARALNLGPVVVVDVLDEIAEKAVGTAEMKDADCVIRPTLGGIGTMDFSKRTDAAFRGKTATENQMDQIRKLVGVSASSGITSKGSP